MTNIHLNNTVMKNSIVLQLRAAGLPHPERHPFTTNYLPRVLHDDEQIMAAVFGRRRESDGLFGFAEGVLIATNMRVLFIDHQPGYTTMDEISYDVVTGVNVSSTIFYASIVLFTKIANYKLSFASQKSVQRFADYIENRVVEHNKDESPTEKPFAATIRGDALEFLNTHEIGVLSSSERTGAISSAVVYYTVANGSPYFVTKLSSKKAGNLLGNQHIAFTIFDESKLQTLQLQGIVTQVTDDSEKQLVMAVVTRPRTYDDGSRQAPLVRMGGNDFVTYKITPTKYNFTDYSKK